MRHLVWLLTLALLCGTGFAAAHEVRPAFLELTETGPTSYTVTFKRPARGAQVLRLYPVFPDDCHEVSGTPIPIAGALVHRSLIECAETLSGRSIKIDGLAGTVIDILVQVNLKSGDSQSLLLRGGDDAFTVARTPSGGEVALSYLGLGLEHILLGIDHLLFVLGLLLVIGGWRQLLGAITAFTLAHSITLALATLGVVDVPQAPVEAVIALSIVFLAAELVRQLRGTPGLTSRRPWLVSFFVGLLHGLGFAGALRDVGLPQAAIPLALMTFNAGVELGQLLFVSVVLGMLALGRRIPELRTKRLPLSAAYAIGTLAGFWVVERTLALL